MKMIWKIILRKGRIKRSVKLKHNWVKNHFKRNKILLSAKQACHQYHLISWKRNQWKLWNNSNHRSRIFNQILSKTTTSACSLKKLQYSVSFPLCFICQIWLRLTSILFIPTAAKYLTLLNALRFSCISLQPITISNRVRSRLIFIPRGSSSLSNGSLIWFNSKKGCNLSHMW